MNIFKVVLDIAQSLTTVIFFAIYRTVHYYRQELDSDSYICWSACGLSWNHANSFVRDRTYSKKRYGFA